MKQTMMNTAAGVLAVLLLGSAGLAWAQLTPAQIQQQEFQRQQNEIGMYYQQQQNNQQATPRGPTAAEIRAWEQREAEVQAEIAELRRTPFYGVVAFDFSASKLVWVAGFKSEQVARQRAMRRCSTSDCRVVAVFNNTCAVLTTPDSGVKAPSDLFFGYDTDDKLAAEKSMQQCELANGRGNCGYSSVETKHGTAFCTGYDYSAYGQ
ncbi:hypothetical protein A7Q03_07010 [Eikenella sp. NML99-0057]|uniref:DUF4189 domain-containing protein n=1 Tax=Eikenella sp. NML99-0057 TaxID=1795834 RepID=UPI0007E1A1B6|nr:DUF4189 domain-containing protein [Eikenella sp. NML99-0057]OAM44948.1 hypothetical protein A7Q03_07010 [Eikenella sp. NML99-0057]